MKPHTQPRSAISSKKCLESHSRLEKGMLAITFTPQLDRLGTHWLWTVCGDLGLCLLFYLWIYCLCLFQSEDIHNRHGVGGGCRSTDGRREEYKKDLQIHPCWQERSCGGPSCLKKQEDSTELKGSDKIRSKKN